MKILLINPPTIYTKWNLMGVLNPPLGLMYLSAVAKENGHIVEIIDALAEAPRKVNKYAKFYYRGMPFERISEKCKKFDLIGISNLFSHSFPVVAALSREIKKKVDVPIVAGGTQISALSEYSLRNSEIDYALIGEAEISFLKLLEVLEKNRDIDEITGLAYKCDGEIRIKPGISFVPDINSLPFPDRNGIDLDIYAKEKEAHGPISGKWTTIMSSRGCPFLCTYCTSPKFNYKYRSRTPENFVEEIERCVKEYGINEFIIEDDNFTLQKKRVIEICKGIIDKGLKIRFQLPNGIRASETDREVLEYMKKAGCTYLCIAPESGSIRILKDIMKKNQNPDRILQVSKDCVDLGIKMGAFFIIGFPTETKRDLKMSFKLAMKLARIGIDDVIVSSLAILPGSYLFDEFMNQDRIYLNEKYFMDLVKLSDPSSKQSYSECVSGNHIRNLRNRMTIMFHLNKLIFHPLKALRTGFNVLTNKQQTKTEKAAIGLIKNAFRTS